MIERLDILTNPRYAGQVLRWHTWPMLRRETVGEHTFQVLRIYSQIFGPPSPEVTETILWHDLGELKTGDLPFPVKSQNPVVKVALDTLEDKATVDMGRREKPKLPVEEQLKVKASDLVDMWESGIVEYEQGNRYAEPILVDVHAALVGILHELGVTSRQAVETYLKRYWSRVDTYMSGIRQFDRPIFRG